MTTQKRGDPPKNPPIKEQYSDIPLNKILTASQSVRQAMDDDHVVELAMSISKHGLLQPIVVKESANGFYQLEAGFHRLCAATRLNWQTIPTHIRNEETGPVKAIALIENIVRRDMSLDEEVTAVNLLNQEENLSPSSICDLLGKSRTWVDQRLSIPNYPEDVKGELLDGNLTISKAEILSKIEHEGTRALLINQVISAKLTTKQAYDLVEMYLVAPSIQSSIEAGLQTQKEIQSAPIPQKTCFICGFPRPIDKIQFQPICVDNCKETLGPAHPDNNPEPTLTPPEDNAPIH